MAVSEERGGRRQNKVREVCNVFCRDGTASKLYNHERVAGQPQRPVALGTIAVQGQSAVVSKYSVTLVWSPGG